MWQEQGQAQKYSIPLVGNLFSLPSSLEDDLLAWPALAFVLHKNTVSFLPLPPIPFPSLHQMSSMEGPFYGMRCKVVGGGGS